MEARIIFTCVLVTTLLGSHAAFANPYAANQEKALPETTGHVAASVEVAVAAKNLLNIRNSDNRTEIMQRIITGSRQELSLQLKAFSPVLEALELSESYLKLAVGNAVGKLNLTAR